MKIYLPYVVPPDAYDCVELFLDTEGTRSKYVHLILSPRQKCYFDSQYGFITDILNTSYGKEDSSWNPDFKYVFKIDEKTRKWQLVVAMPFASLGVKTPEPGTVWNANFCRERYAGKNTELSLWSPNDEGSGFNDANAFGKLYFEKKSEQ